MSIRSWLEARRRRKAVNACMKKHGCVLFCPKCDSILHDYGVWSRGTIGKDIVYTIDCACGEVSRWNFDIIPGAILVDERGVPIQGAAA